MKRSNKFSLSEVMNRTNNRLRQLGRQTVSTLNFNTLFLAWMRHPRYTHPTLGTLRNRMWTDGFQWLKSAEMDSFIQYATE